MMFLPVESGNFTAIRILRILRPLRVVNKVPALRIMVQTLITSMSGLFDVFVLMMFLFIIYAIIGIQLWKGVLRRRCFNEDFFEVGFSVPYTNDTQELEFCGNSSLANSCPSSTPLCLAEAGNPNAGLVAFDNIFVALFTVFQSITLADWGSTMFAIMDTWGSPAWFYFVTLVLVVSFFAINLVLAVVSEVFGDFSKEQRDVEEADRLEDELKEQEALAADDTLHPIVEQSGSEEEDDDDEEEDSNENDNTSSGIERSASPDTLEQGRQIHQTGNSMSTSTSRDSLLGNQDGRRAGAGTGTDIQMVPLQANPLHTGPPKSTSSGSGKLPQDKVKRTTKKKAGMNKGKGITASSSNTSLGSEPSDDDSSVSRSTSLWDDPVENTAQPRRDLTMMFVGALHDDLTQSKIRKLHERTQKFGGESLVPTPIIDRDVMAAVCRPILREVRKEYEVRREWLSGKPLLIHHVFDLVEHSIFSSFIFLAIIVNTIFLAMDSPFASESVVSVLAVGNLICGIIFVIEMVLKLLGYGPRGYSRDAWNVFDGAIVIVTIMEWTLSSGGGGVSVFRTFRLMRVLKLARQIKSLRILLGTVVASLVSVSWMTMLLFLFIFMFAVLGMQLFSDQLEGVERTSFENCYYAVLAVFQILTGDNWTGLMASTVRVTGTQAALVYFLAVIVFGGFIVINLFIAILLENFSIQDDEKFERDVVEARAESLVVRKKYDEEKALKSLCRHLTQHRLANYEDKLKKEMQLKLKKEMKHMEGKSLGYFGPEHPVRRFCWGLVHSSPFQYFIILCILVNCGFLAAEGPDLDPDSDKGRLFYTMDIVFTTIFIAEMVIKWIALGVFKNPNAYFRDSWNTLDAFVVLVSVVALFLPDVAVAKAFRALRPIRIVVRSESIRVIISSVYKALPAIGNVLLFCLLCWLIFGILGMNLFGGKFYSCTNPELKTKAACEASTEPGVEWVNPSAHFDNVLQAIVTLFQVATLSGWTDIMFNSMDVTHIDEAPQKNNHPEAALFYIIFVISCAFFTINLFIGVVIDNFNRLKTEFDGSAFLSEEQRKWVLTQKLVKSVTLAPLVNRPKSDLRRICYDVITWPFFDPIVMVLIILNTLMMCTEHYNQSEGFTDFQYHANLIFVVAFGAEAVLKITGLRFGVYWKDPWNRFDFVLAVVSVVGLFVDAGVGANVLRVLRIGRIFRLIKRAKSLKKMFDTFIISLPSLWNIAALLLVIFFIFSILSISLFGKVLFTDDGLNSNLNFSNFFTAMLTLYVMATGDAWDTVMYGCTITPSNSDCSYAEENCGSEYAPAFFVLFMILGGMVMVNLYIAVILENFGSDIQSFDADDEEVLENDAIMGLREWTKHWRKYDPLASRYLPVSKFERVMSEAPLPFGFGHRLARLQVLRSMQRTKIPIFYRSPVNGLASNLGLAMVDEENSSNEEVWMVSYDATLKTLAKTIAKVGVIMDEEPGDSDVVDAWKCDWCTPSFTKGPPTSTVDEWYAVQLLEESFLRRKGRLTEQFPGVNGARGETPVQLEAESEAASDEPAASGSGSVFDSGNNSSRDEDEEKAEEK